MFFGACIALIHGFKFNTRGSVLTWPQALHESATIRQDAHEIQPHTHTHARCISSTLQYMQPLVLCAPADARSCQTCLRLSGYGERVPKRGDSSSPEYTHANTSASDSHNALSPALQKLLLSPSLALPGRLVPLNEVHVSLQPLFSFNMICIER